MWTNIRKIWIQNQQWFSVFPDCEIEYLSLFYAAAAEFNTDVTVTELFQLLTHSLPS